MRIELDQKDILAEIKENYRDDVEFFYLIIDNNTTSWETYRELTKKLIANLKRNNEFIPDELGLE